jgi:hypothetical protein
MKKLLVGLFLIPTLCSAESYEFQRKNALDGTKVNSNAVLRVDITKTGRNITLNGTSDPDSMSATCNIEGFTNVINKVSKIDYFILTTEKTNAESENCGVLVDVWKDPNSKRTMSTVRMSEGYGCQSFCGMQGNAHDLEGVYY